MGAGAAEVSVYVMNGEVVAATSPDDERVLVHLLQRQGVLRRKIVRQLEEALENSQPIFGDLLTYGGKALDRALYARFENNLATFVGSISAPGWEALRTVFVDNLQMGHDTAQLIEGACDLWDRASVLDVDTMVETGATPFDDDDALWVAKAVGRGARTVSSILLALPMEELRARVEILDMLDKGMIRVAGLELDEDDAPTESPDVEDIADQETVYGVDVAALEARLEAEEAQTLVDAPPAASEDAETADFTADEEAAHAAPLPSTTERPSTLDQWMQQMSSVDEDELEFFQDHDHERGSAEQGAFSTEQHNLDRVEVVDLQASDDDVIAVDEAPTARFGAPVLGENEALEKIGVANEALAHIVAAFDAAEGPGKGRAVVQLLVEGCPSRYAALFHAIQVGEAGEIPDAELIENLASRPPTEHRQLLNSGLLDVVDRAISSAADELPDEAFDAMYEAVAGFRKRLTL